MWNSHSGERPMTIRTPWKRFLRPLLLPPTTSRVSGGPARVTSGFSSSSSGGGGSAWGGLADRSFPRSRPAGSSGVRAFTLVGTRALRS